MKLFLICLRHFFAFLGWIGAILIVYTAVAAFTKEQWKPLEQWAGPVSSLLTVIGTALTALQIYFPSTDIHPPDRFSKLAAAPVVIIGCLVAVVVWFRAFDLPITLVNGFALLGLAGAFFRLQRKPDGY